MKTGRPLMGYKCPECGATITDTEEKEYSKREALQGAAVGFIGAIVFYFIINGLIADEEHYISFLGMDVDPVLPWVRAATVIVGVLCLIMLPLIAFDLLPDEDKEKDEEKAKHDEAPATKEATPKEAAPDAASDPAEGD